MNSLNKHIWKSSIAAATKIVHTFFYTGPPPCCWDMVDDRVATEQNRCFRVALSTSYTACILSPSHQQCSSLTSVTVPTRFLARNTQTSASFGHGESIQLLRPCTCSANYSVWCVYKTTSAQEKGQCRIGCAHRVWPTSCENRTPFCLETCAQDRTAWRQFVERATYAPVWNSLVVGWYFRCDVTTSATLAAKQTKDDRVLCETFLFSLQSNFISSGLRSLQSWTFIPRNQHHVPIARWRNLKFRYVSAHFIGHRVVLLRLSCACTPKYTVFVHLLLPWNISNLTAETNLHQA